MISGAGIVEMTGINAFSSEGTIRANGGTLTLRRSAGSTSSFDWDGGNTTNVLLHADDLSVLRIEIPLSDPVLNGTIRVDQGALFEATQNFSLGGGGASSPGIINLNGVAGAAVLGGSNLINVTNQFSVLNVNSGNGIVQADLIVTLGQVNISGGDTLTLAGDATFSDASRLNFQGPASSRLIVQGTTSISNGQFDWDGVGNTITTINSGGVLNVDVTSLNPSSSTLFTGTINNSGVLDVSVNVTPDQWTMDGQMNLTGGVLNSADADTLLVTGELNASSQQNSITTAVEIESGGSLNVTGFGSDLTLSASTRIENGSSVSVAGNSLLVLGGTTTWASPTSVSGGGTIRQQGSSIVTGSTTINTMVYDWDGTSGAAQTSVNAGGSLTINAAIEASGAQFDGTLRINSGRVTVNTPTPWTSVGLIAFNGLGGGPNELNGQKLFMQENSSSMTASFGTATINADIEFAGNTDVRVSTGGSGFDFQGDVTFNSTTIAEDNPGFSSYAGNVNVNGTTTINTSTTTFASTSNVMLDSGSTLILGGITDYAGGMVSGDGTLMHNGAGTVNGAGIDVETIQVAATGSLTVNDGDVTTTNFEKLAGGGFTLDGGQFTVAGGDAVFNASFTYGGSQADDPTFRVLDGADAAVTFSWHAGVAADEYGTTIVSGTNNAGDRRSTLRGTGGGGGADFYVGNAGHGVAVVDKGGLVRLRDDVIVANSAGSTGELTIDGVFDHPVVGPIRSELDVTVSGTGAVIDVGLGGTGTLYVIGGALAHTSGDVRVGHLAGASGTVNVGGQNLGFHSELQVADDIIVGDLGQGLVNISAGGKVTADTVDLRGMGGSLNLTGGELSVNRLDLSEPGSVFQMTTGILHAVVVDGDLAPVGGIVAPGNSAGTTTVTENFLPGIDATLQIEIGGLNAGSDYDQLIVGSNAIIDGMLDVSLINGYLLGTNNMYEIVDVAGELTGEFAGLPQNAHVGLFGGVSLFIDYLGGDGNDIVLFTESGLAGDYNNDLTVDAADYTVWRDNLGSTTILPNDPSPGMVTKEDYDTWKTHFGEMVGDGSGASANLAVPEPATAILLILATATWCFRRCPTA